jgi:hypothetical protein
MIAAAAFVLGWPAIFSRGPNAANKITPSLIIFSLVAQRQTAQLQQCACATMQGLDDNLLQCIARYVDGPHQLAALSFASQIWRTATLPLVCQAPCPGTKLHAAAASRGHLHLIQWLHASSCPWDETLCASAAQHGHLDVLKWARENGALWDKWTCAYAAKSGHLAVLQ